MTISYKTANGRKLASYEIAHIHEDDCEGYEAYDDELKLAIFEAKGERERQEDRVAVSAIPQLEQCDLQTKRVLFQETLQALQLQFADQYKNVGTTVLINIIEPTRITTIWLGDSPSFLILYDQHSSLTLFRPLNSTLHHPDLHTREGQRVALIANRNGVPPPFEDFPGVWRLGDGLALSRALGDVYSEQYGLSHDPEICETDYHLRTGDYGFVITACDGLTEAMSLVELQKFLCSLKKSHPSILAKKLVRRALNKEEANYRKRSMDNVSVMVAALNPLLPTRVVALFDGHNGSYLSQALSRHFFPVLKEKLKQLSI